MVNSRAARLGDAPDPKREVSFSREILALEYFFSLIKISYFFVSLSIVAIGENAATEAHHLSSTKGSLIWLKRNAKRIKNEKPERAPRLLPTRDLHPLLTLTVVIEKKKAPHQSQTLALLLLPNQIGPLIESVMTVVHHLWQTHDSLLRPRLIVRTMITAAMSVDLLRLQIRDSQLQLHWQNKSAKGKVLVESEVVSAAMTTAVVRYHRTLDSLRR